MKAYVTFGQVHKHDIRGVHFDKDCIAEFEAYDEADAFSQVFMFFGRKFCVMYLDDKLTPEILSYFPRGIVKVP